MQIKEIKPENLPKRGYYSSRDERKNNFYKTESHIHKQTPLNGAKATIHKFTNDILTYFPKGFKGSKNSDFYEYLSLGMFPFVTGSILLGTLYGANNKNYTVGDKAAAGQVAKKMGAGIVLYAAGRWLSSKLINLATYASTGVNLDMHCINKRNELPEPGKDKGVIRTQYQKVYDSVEFPRTDLIAKYSELEHGNIYWYYDKIAKKAGYKEKLNAPNQVIEPKIRQLRTRNLALERIAKYIAAATGVVLGHQKAFGELKLSKNSFKNKLKSVTECTKNGCKQLWQGTNRNFITKNYGKALIAGSAISALLAWLVPTIAFKTKENTIKSEIDHKKEFEVG